MLFWPTLWFPPINLWSAPRLAAPSRPRPEVVFPSDMDRAEHDELNRVCEALEEMLDHVDAVEQDNRDLRREVAAWRGL